MNSILCEPADTIFDKTLFGDEIATDEDAYITEPIPVVKGVAFSRPDEEEVYTSFEEALSDRLTAMHGRLNRLSNPLLNAQLIECNTNPILSTNMAIENAITTRESVQSGSATDRLELASYSADAWRRATTYICIAMMFMLLGFDLMGLFILHMH